MTARVLYFIKRATQLVMFAILFGLVIPAQLSASNDLHVAAGLLCAFVTSILAVAVGNDVVRDIKKGRKSK